MKANILDITGKKKATIDLPSFFSKKIREDIVFKALESQKSRQPHSPSLVAGKQHSASGTIRHRRHVWKTHYGKGYSRIPRKTMSRRGAQFNWEGAEISSTRGGRRAHPPKILSMINTKKINKKEMKEALSSALSATADEKTMKEKYSTLKKEKIRELPLVVESKIITLKTKQLLETIKNIVSKPLYKAALKKKKIRAGKGKLRGRKYKKNAGLLLIIGKNEKLRTGAFDIKSAKDVNITDLAKGGMGRLTLYTEQAIKDLGERLK